MVGHFPSTQANKALQGRKFVTNVMQSNCGKNNRNCAQYAELVNPHIETLYFSATSFDLTPLHKYQYAFDYHYSTNPNQQLLQ